MLHATRRLRAPDDAPPAPAPTVAPHRACADGFPQTPTHLGLLQVRQPFLRRPVRRNVRHGGCTLSLTALLCACGGAATAALLRQTTSRPALRGGPGLYTHARGAVGGREGFDKAVAPLQRQSPLGPARSMRTGATAPPSAPHPPTPVEGLLPPTHRAREGGGPRHHPGTHLPALVERGVRPDSWRLLGLRLLPPSFWGGGVVWS